MPRRQRGEGAVFQRASDGLWVGRVELGYIDGKRARKQVTAHSQAGAIRKLNEAKKAAAAGDLTTTGTTLERYLQHWLDDVCPAKGIKPGTLAGYREKTRNYVVPALGKVRLDRLQIQHARSLARYVTDQGLSSQTAMHAHRVLSDALNDAMREGLVTRNVASLAGAPSVVKPEQKPLSLAEARALFAQVEDDRLAARWQMALTTGARQGECLGLQWDRVDLDNGILDLAWQLQRIPYRHGCSTQSTQNGASGCGRKRADRCPQRQLDVHPGFEYKVLEGNQALQRPKTKGSRRLVVMSAPLVESMRRRRAAWEVERAAYTLDHNLVWARTDGRPIDGRADYRAWQEHLKAAGVPALPLHSARHTAASVLLALGVSEHVIQTMLGHSEVLTTRGYAHVDVTLQRQAMEQLGGALAIGR